jgi:hypothetical protein
MLFLLPRWSISQPSRSVISVIVDMSTSVDGGVFAHHEHAVNHFVRT